NSIPVIKEVTGLASLDIFESGFDTKNIQTNVTDSNNLIIPYDEQDLKFQLYNSTGVLLKENTYTRPNVNQDFVFNIDSTYAAGISFARNYRMRLTTTDLYDASATIDFTNITIRNEPPSLYNLQFQDTIFVPIEDPVYFSVEVNVNDPQGHLSYQDIDEVLITTVSSRSMRDDGSEFPNSNNEYSSDLVKNNGVYTIEYEVRNSYLPPDESIVVLPFSIQAKDKAGNMSPVISGQFIFVKNSKNSIKRRNDENSFNYINPFDHL
ncbi:MAG: hypothetical protein KKD38_00370, partial [Candidatus Delongbacteria bacterium]|nr:hypothetical protein [Candidatus Delongbacteria bacterium]MCG2760905.1 hypothetical protein [Candidatus Delongbacteria bacterium]